MITGYTWDIPSGNQTWLEIPDDALFGIFFGLTIYIYIVLSIDIFYVKSYIQYIYIYTVHIYIYIYNIYIYITYICITYIYNIYIYI